MPWELIGLVAVLAVFVVGAVVWWASSGGRGELQAPTAPTVPEEGRVALGVTPDGRPYVGAPDARVRVMEFADFQCPFCRKFAAEEFWTFLDGVIADGTVQWQFYAVGFDGRESLAAAVAAQCALREDRFWPMHDWLYANASVVIDSGAFARDRLVAMAGQVGLDPEAFERCLDDPAVAELVLDNEARARALGINATPTFVVGERLVQGLDMVGLRAVVEAAAGE